jgi:hypothetical protein
MIDDILPPPTLRHHIPMRDRDGRPTSRQLVLSQSTIRKLKAAIPDFPDAHDIKFVIDYEASKL